MQGPVPVHPAEPPGWVPVRLGHGVTPNAGGGPAARGGLPSDVRPGFEEGLSSSGIVRPAVGVQDAPGSEFEIAEPQFSNDLCLELGEVVGLGEGLADHLPGCDTLGRGHLVDGREDLPGQGGSFACQRLQYVSLDGGR